VKIVWTLGSLQDLDHAYEFITEQSPKAANQIINKIKNALSNLQIYPNVGRKGRIEGTRELVIPNTPFLLSYRVKETHIEILAFLHGRRKWPQTVALTLNRNSLRKNLRFGDNEGTTPLITDN